MAPRARKFDADVHVDSSSAGLALRGIANRAGDMRPAFRVIRDLIVAGHKRNWASKGQYLGAPWPANTIGTVERKARMEQPLDLLTASGALHRAIHGGRGRYTRATKASVAVGVRLFYAKFHLAKKGRLPRRQMVGIASGTERRAMEVIERHLIRGTR